MHFEPGHIYHVYNRGNNRTPIFFNRDNYLYILRKAKQEWRLYCDICCYCLMPNHFHFMLSPKEKGCETVMLKGLPTHLQKLSKVIGKTLSSYTQGINIQNNTTGSLFQKRTKAKCLTDPLMNRNYGTGDYLSTCFHYIHNNPLKARLVRHLADWPFSSWLDYYGNRKGVLCNKGLTMERLGMTENDFVGYKSFEEDERIVDFIW